MVHKNIPLAVQVLNDLTTGIETGALVRANGQLPSEEELSKQFGVSRSTVREALSRLEQRGSVTRQHGIGTFVASQPLILDTGLEQLESIDTLARRVGLETQVGEAQIFERLATQTEYEQLQLLPGSQVLVVNRLILATGKPVAYLTDIVPTSFLRAKDLDQVFKGSVLDIFIQRGAPAVSYAQTEINFEPINSSIMHKLNLGSADIIIKLESLLFSRDGQRIDFSFSYFIPGFFRFHVVRRVIPGEIYNPQKN